MSKYGAIVNYQ